MILLATFSGSQLEEDSGLTGSQRNGMFKRRPLSATSLNPTTGPVECGFQTCKGAQVEGSFRANMVEIKRHVQAATSSAASLNDHQLGWVWFSNVQGGASWSDRGHKPSRIKIMTLVGTSVGTEFNTLLVPR
jgi:hypothetical protein